MRRISALLYPDYTAFRAPCPPPPTQKKGGGDGVRFAVESEKKRWRGLRCAPWWIRVKLPVMKETMATAHPRRL